VKDKLDGEAILKQIEERDLLAAQKEAEEEAQSPAVKKPGH
jgi:hypothetical protein